VRSSILSGRCGRTPRQYQVRIRVEPGNKRQAAGSVTVTVDLEDSRTGESIATKTLAAGQLDEAACAVAGYVARQIFSADPTAPPWCYGKSDGSDLAALLAAWQDRVDPKSPRDIPEARTRQMDILERGASSSVCAGVARHELAQLHDISGFQLEAVRLHAMNREQYPRFYRGRYRLGMSLEMIASPEFKLKGRRAEETLRECLDILDRCRVSHHYNGRDHEIKVGEPLPRPLRMELLMAAQAELCAVQRQLNPWYLIWAAFVHRDERAIWKHYWRPAERERFRDGVRVAELLVAVRQRLNEKELNKKKKRGRAQGGSGQGRSAAARDQQSGAKQEQHHDGHHGGVSYYFRRAKSVYGRIMAKYETRARWITAAITGDNDTIKAVLNCKDPSCRSAAERPFRSVRLRREAVPAR
jgi:hypothetical protein